MTNMQILEKVIYKAEENGCNRCLSGFLDYHDEKDITVYNKHYQIIFSHDFAKAFWGNDEVDERGRTLIKVWEEEYRASGLFMDFDEFVGEPEIYYEEEWIYHLIKMVREKEPLKYLEKFL